MPRRRRTPDQARGEILAAATEVMAQRGPDGAGLREVAEAAGVTHGLVTHYFGTYGALVRAVLLRANEQQRERLRERMRADGGVPYAEAMTRLVLESVSDERYIRLWAWSSLYSEDAGVSSRDLSEFVDALQVGISTVLPEPNTPDRNRIEAVVLLCLSAAYGYALGNRAWLAGLGHDPTDPVHADAFRATLAAAVAAHLTAPPLADQPARADDPRRGGGRRMSR